MGRTVGKTVETDRALAVRLLGAPAVTRGGTAVALPRSRKVRALLGFLALSPRPVARSRLCDLLWDVPNDPRGELRWSLSKLRGVLDDEAHRRVSTEHDTVALDLTGCVVDALEVDRAVQQGLDELSAERIAALCDLFRGDLLQGVELDDRPELTGWLSAQRHRYRALHVRLLEAYAARARGEDDTFRRLDAWLEIAPFDPRAHRVLLETLVRGGRHRDAEEHVARTIRSFEDEGLDWQPLRDAWDAVKHASVASAGPSRIEAPSPSVPVPVALDRPRRASIAVMPFSERAGRSTAADGLTEDIIVQLAKLRLLFVIARGTVFALAERGVSPQEAGRILNVDYVASGGLRGDGARRTVLVELADVREGRIVWTDTLDAGGATFSVIESIVDRIVAAIAEQIEHAEMQRAQLRPPSSLDAWESYHRGLWHMYRFTGPDNREAEQLFRASLRLDPTFARAHAGLSFTHFQNAFLDLAADRDRQIELAYETARASLGADDHDPAAHWAMGRALWLRGAQRESLAELERSVELSPNFALGHYTLGFVNSQSGDPRAAIEAVSYSRQLSPFDPLQFGMLASRALAHVRLDEYQEAAEWAIKAAARPNAHTHILAIAASCLALANRPSEARAFVARIRERTPSYSVADFMRAFRFDRDAERVLRGAARQLGID